MWVETPGRHHLFKILLLKAYAKRNGRLCEENQQPINSNATAEDGSVRRTLCLLNCFEHETCTQFCQ